MDIKRQEGESEEQFIWRLGRAKDAGTLDLGWEEIADIVNKEFREDDSEYRNESAYRKPYQQAKRFYEAGVFKDLTTEQYIQLLRLEQLEMKKERQKFRDEKLEYNSWLREQARDELIAERICDAIVSLPKLDIPATILPTPSKKAGILLLADSHYGAELKINGLFGEILNEYNPEIFEARMWELFGKVVSSIQKEGLSELSIYDLGDNIDGLLRVSQLMKLRYGVLESAVRYGRFMTEWLNKLTKYVKVKYQMVNDSNHNQLRMLGQPKNTFKNENVSILIKEKIMDRLGDNPNFEFIQNPTGLVFEKALGYNILGIHGEVKNFAQAMKDFSHVYGEKIDILIAGHKHHQASENVGIGADIVAAPSLIGIDDYSMSLHKTSDPGATLFIVEEGYGKNIEYDIKLKK